MKRALWIVLAVALVITVAWAAPYYYTLFIRTNLTLQDGATLVFSGNNVVTHPSTDSINTAATVVLSPVSLSLSDDTLTVPDGY